MSGWSNQGGPVQGEIRGASMTKSSPWKVRYMPNELAIASELERFLHASYKAGTCPGCSNPVQRLMPKVMEIVERLSPRRGERKK